ncbi:MAG: protocatechuate 3,4-dioxygenase subunit alpha [Alphaproteobacteria bacterium]
MPKQTPSQTVGPFFAYGLTPDQYGYGHPGIAGGSLRDDTTTGQPIRIEGCVYDGDGNTVPDAVIEIWQADSAGRYPGAGGANAAFTGFGRCGTGTLAGDLFAFDTVKPGAAGDGQAPHVTLVVFMRGLLTHAFTRVYFPEDAAAHATDPVLNAVPADRRQTLIAARRNTATGPVYRFDIHMQGPRETVFLDI